MVEDACGICNRPGLILRHVDAKTVCGRCIKIEPLLRLHPGVSLHLHETAKMVCIRHPLPRYEKKVTACGFHLPSLIRVRKEDYPLVITRSLHFAAPNYTICPSCLNAVAETVIRERDGVEDLNNFLISVFTAFGKEITKGVV